jgi:hemoglobin
MTLDAARHGENSAFARMGGRDGLRRLAARFYEIMSEKPSAAGIRAMHKADLGPISESLAEFLMGWIGGPRDWFMRGDRPCIMSLHRALPIGEGERDQWLACMQQALEETVPDVELRQELGPAFFRIANAMRSS